MRTKTTTLWALAITVTAFAAPRHDPVVLVTPPRDGSPLLTRTDIVAPNVRTFTRDRGARSFRVPLTGVPEEGPLRYGVTPAETRDLIAVRTREPLPTLLVSPFEDINERTRDELRRQFPYVRRVDTVTDDLRRAQRQYLREQGLILNVRTFRGTPASGVTSNRPTPRVLEPGEEVNATATRVLPREDTTTPDQSPE
ncbi:MAG: hypothetical protein Tsb0013_19210 [Phycisphaerales bacterium]